MKYGTQYNVTDVTQGERRYRNYRTHTTLYPVDYEVLLYIYVGRVAQSV